MKSSTTWLSVMLEGAPRHAPLAWAAALFTVFALAALTVFNGTTVINAPADVFILLDQAWRMHSGQVPHTDFDNSIGVVTYALIHAGMSLGGSNAGALAIAPVLFLAPVTVWAFCIAASRLPPSITCAFVIWIALLTLATRPLGYEPTNHSYAMIYNRYGWVILCLLAMQAFIPPRTRITAATEALSLGLLLGALVYIKVSYAGFGALAIALALAARPDLRAPKSIFMGAVGVALFALLVWVSVGVDPLSYFEDVSAAAQSQSTGARLRRLLDALRDGILPLALLAIAWLALVGQRVWRSREFDPRVVMMTLQVGLLCGAALLIAATNTGERGQIPLFVVAALVLWVNADVVAPAQRWRFATGAIGAAALFPAVQLASLDALSIIDTTAWRAYRLADAPEAQRFQSARLRDSFVIPASSTHLTQYWAAGDVPARINDGLALLREHATAESRVFAVAVTNPFSFALSLRPPRGGPLWWDRNLSYAPERPPPADKVFAQVTHIMVPVPAPSDIGCCRSPLEDIPSMYASYWSADFREIARSRYWRLLARTEMSAHGVRQQRAERERL